MKTNRVTGTFDCRIWKKDTVKSARLMVANGDRINLSVGFDESEIPTDIKEFARKSSKSERWYVTFKVFPKNCKMYTASAKQVEFPTNEKLDGGRFEMIIDYSVKHGTGTELNGGYANAIQVIKRADNPFDAVEDGDDNFMETKTAEAIPETTAAGGEKDSDLPF